MARTAPSRTGPAHALTYPYRQAGRESTAKRPDGSPRTSARASNREPDLALVVGAARSGTTLLRLMLDVHPEIGCPGEAGIPSLIRSVGNVWWTVSGRREEDWSVAALSPTAQHALRDAVTAPMADYCAREGKRIYCDKSLDSVHHLKLVHELFPTARYLLIFRHVMDTVASGLEANPFGFRSYGYLPFIQTSPDNLVAALVSYWLNHVASAVAWEEAHPELCHRVRYEDLVVDPERSVTEVCRFLDVAPDLSVLDRVFDRARLAGGPGDHKIIHTTAVHTASIGAGKRIPVALVPPPLLEAANERLAALGYEPVTPAWNAEPTSGPANGANGSGAELETLMQISPRNGRSTSRRTVGPFALVAQDHDHLRWIIDPRSGDVRQGDGEVEFVITGTADDLRQMIIGGVNPAVLLRAGRVRHLHAGEPSTNDAVQTMLDELEILRDIVHVGGQPDAT